MSDPAPAMRVTLALAAMVPLLSAVELLMGRGATRFGGSGQVVIPWRAEEVRRLMLITSSIAASTLQRLAVAQAALAAISVLLPDPLRSLFLLTLSVTAWLLVKRLPWGEDAADQMSRVLLVAGGAAGAVGSLEAQLIFLWFAAAQSCVAYFTAGISKLCAAEWRGGDALAGILSTDAFGRRAWAGVLLRHRRSARAVAWLVVGFECAFPLVLAGQTWLTDLLLIAGVVFHVGVAALMRLNTFPFAFIAAYPAVAYCSRLAG